MLKRLLSSWHRPIWAPHPFPYRATDRKTALIAAPSLYKLSGTSRIVHQKLHVPILVRCFFSLGATLLLTANKRANASNFSAVNSAAGVTSLLWGLGFPRKIGWHQEVRLTPAFCQQRTVLQPKAPHRQSLHVDVQNFMKPATFLLPQPQ